jgi:hypothetical protein
MLLGTLRMRELYRATPMSLSYYKAIRARLARRRLAVRKAALSAEKILRHQDPPDYSMRCERPGCSHERADHAARVCPEIRVMSPNSGQRGELPGSEGDDA